jgi:hypothetical protein
MASKLAATMNEQHDVGGVTFPVWFWIIVLALLAFSVINVIIASYATGLANLIRDGLHTKDILKLPGANALTGNWEQFSGSREHMGAEEESDTESDSDSDSDSE